MSSFRPAGKPIRVLVFNDSPTVRVGLRQVLDRAPDIAVIGEASDGRGAEDLVDASLPDLVLMDAVMPHVGGFSATRAIMARRPVPIVIISAVLDPRDSKVVFEALSAGALCVVESLPSPHLPEFSVKAMGLIQLVRSMASVRVPGTVRDMPARVPPREVPARSSAVVDVIGIVASTGGPGVLVDLLMELSSALPPVLVVQHLPPGFAPSFAQWLQERTRKPVIVPEASVPLESGVVYVAPSERHLGITRHRTVYLDDSPPISLFRPSGNFLLESIAKGAGDRAVGLILTGMGDDGASGARALRQAGGKLAVQDERTSVVYGMLRVAVEIAGADAIVPAAGLAAWLKVTCGIEAGNHR